VKSLIHLFLGASLLVHLQAPFAQEVTQQPGGTDAQFATRKAVLARIAADDAAVARMPHSDIYMDRVPKGYPRPQSVWQNAEEAFYEDVLTKGRFDVLVVPFQVQNYAFGRQIRSLMTAQLVMAMRAAGGGSIPDPYLVARALGESDRRHDATRVIQLANKLGAKRIVLCYVGHDPKKPKTMRVTVHYFDRDGPNYFTDRFAPRTDRFGRLFVSESVNVKHFDDIPFSDERTPIDAYQSVQPAVLKFLGLQAAAPAPVVSRFEPGAVPASPLAMVADKGEPARDAYYLQLLAALAPGYAERVRERLVEKSMLALMEMSPTSPDYRSLKARALMNMGLRLAAIDALGTPTTAEERHLLALLNGNLPQVLANRRQVAPGVRAFIAALEENAIATAYDARTVEQSLAEVEKLKLPGDVWRFLAARALTDGNSWTQHANLLLKGVLDHEFPLEGFSAEGMMRGAAAVGVDEKLQTRVDLSVLDHVRRQTQREAPKWCCQPLAARPAASDYLDLLEGIGTDNLVRQAKLLHSVQSLPERAIAFLGRIDGVYKDHPQLVLVRAQAELMMSEAAAGLQREALRRSAWTAAFNAWYWEQAQTRTAAEAFRYVIRALWRPEYTDYGSFDNFYVRDYPFRSHYPFWTQPLTVETWMQNARAGLDNASFDFYPVEWMSQTLGGRKQWDQVDAVLKSVENRFVGHPKRVQLMAESSERKGDLRGAEKHYREAMRAQPSDHQAYEKLGRLLFEEAAPENAASVFMSYPGLDKPSEAHPVDVSNYAYEAGSLFYWTGDFKRAIPLYQVSAKLRTGANSSLASEIRLNLINGDYAAALQGSLERAQRYRSSPAYRDSLGLMHAMGRSTEAWDAFNSLISEIEGSDLWETALVGLQMRASSEKEISRWLSGEPMRSAGGRFTYAPMFLLRAGVTDRMPSTELASLLAAIERPVWKLQDNHGTVVRTIDGKDAIVLGPPSTPAERLWGPFETVAKTRVKSEFVYFAEAYRALRGGEFAAARDGLREAVALYDTKSHSLGYLLPYYAYAAARSGDVAAVEAILDTFTREQHRFDYYLSKAVIAAVQDKTADATRYLSLALHRRPFTGRRPVLPEYQYAELCEWLFEATRNPQYRDVALNWARQNQTFQPWFAWPYAIEAKLATTPEERRRAMAMTHYLDKNSERLSRLPQDEIAAAVKEFTLRNPFRAAAGSAPRRPI
jgi:tetratricopeptide (TPR) repeat protein